ncbi:metal-dependent transcriptional regulator [uncultured Allofournierella sp.]|uniref:metal-dependent transcriptional regulator n=1 Tax=uncultured Allofournierella sp. TaxID=1940258 RepID=UPI003751D1A7
MKIMESAEDYLETILVLFKRNGSVRSIDTANEMDFSKPSVSTAMKKLRENGYVQVDDGGMITLTQSGRHIAETIYERHTLISQLLMDLGVPEDIAKEDACRLEHNLHPVSFEKIKAFYLRQKQL